MFLLVFAAISLLAILLFIAWVITPKTISLEKEHVLITGGSRGIGEALGIEAAKQGANVTILARNEEQLARAKRKIEEHIKYSNQRITCLKFDITKNYDELQKILEEVETDVGSIGVLINCAGISVAKKFEDIPIHDFQNAMNVNYLGSVHVTKALVKSMKNQNRGRIVFVSSQAGQMGMFGYAAYSPTKFALRGLAEALQMELKPYNIYVTLAFPPDTDTDSFKAEQPTLPQETRLISDTSGVFKATHVAAKLIEDVKLGSFQSYVGLDGWMLSIVTSGMSPVTSLSAIFQQVFLVGILRLIALCYLASFDRIIKKCRQVSEKSKKQS